MAHITIATETQAALTTEQSKAYAALEAARATGSEKDQRKARRALRKTGIYLSKTTAHNGKPTLTPEPGTVPTDTPKEVAARIKAKVRGTDAPQG